VITGGYSATSGYNVASNRGYIQAINTGSTDYSSPIDINLMAARSFLVML